MTTESTLVKRRALFKGEVGFFPDDPMAQDDVDLATMNEPVICTWYRPKNIQQLRFLWGLVHKAQENSDLWLDRYVAMEDLKRRAHFTVVKYDPKTKQLKETVRSLTRISDEQLRLLTDRIGDIICAEILPGMERNLLYREIEEMLGIGPRPKNNDGQAGHV